MCMRSKQILSALLAVLPALAGTRDVRLKELVSLEGVRDNQLVGYGLVVGLNGTGDKRQTLFTASPQHCRPSLSPDPVLTRRWPPSAMPPACRAGF